MPVATAAAPEGGGPAAGSGAARAWRGGFQPGPCRAAAEKGLVATLSAEGQELARLLSLTLAAPIPRELIERCGLPDVVGGNDQQLHNA
ncbi:MAG TPA: hypothetical protein VER57_01430, partial [Cyanobium sp.]|nr:hypothetical protein [Cyanobium sp.]